MLLDGANIFSFYCAHPQHVVYIYYLSSFVYIYIVYIIFFVCCWLAPMWKKIYLYKTKHVWIICFTWQQTTTLNLNLETTYIYLVIDERTNERTNELVFINNCINTTPQYFTTSNSTWPSKLILLFNGWMIDDLNNVWLCSIALY